MPRFFARMTEVPSAVFVFYGDLACELEIENFLNTEGAIENDRGGIC